MKHRPVLRLSGSDFACALTAIFAENLHDFLCKVDDGSGEFEKGFFHTSSVEHEWPCYYKRVWTRDAGRGLIELCRLGFKEEAQRVTGYLLTHINLHTHWGRTTQFDDQRPYEVDGNALILLGVCNTWRISGSRKETAAAYLEKLAPVIKWVQEMMDGCAYGDLLPCQTEMAGNPNAPYQVLAIFPNYAMSMALEALCGMARGAESRETKTLEALAERLSKAIREELVASDKRRTATPSGCWINGLDNRDGRVYDFSEWDGTAWPVYHWTRQLPFILQADHGGTQLREDEDRTIHEKSYAYLHSQMATGRFFRKYGFVSNSAFTGMGGRHDDTMCGYGQGYMTQAALLMDDINTYTRLLEGVARLGYDGNIVVPMAFELNPWLMHECFTYENYEEGLDHTFGVAAMGRPGLMNNPGEEGNLVQEAEILKVFSLVAGVEGTVPGHVVLRPRLPWDCAEIAAEDFPYLNAQGELRFLSYTMTHDRAKRSCLIKVTSKEPIEHLDIRVGPFPAHLRTLSGEPSYEVEKCQTGSWIWLRGLSGTQIQREIDLW